MIFCLLVALLFAALAEEMTFRGVFLQAFTAWTRNPLIGALLSILLSWQTYAQGQSIVIALGSDTLLALLFAGLVAVTAWVMAEANAIADEHAQFV